MRRVHVIEAPTPSALDELLSLDEAKAYLRVDGIAEDETIRILLASIRSEVETAFGACLAVQRLRYVALRLGTLDAGGWGLSMPRTPVRSIDKVTAIERDGMETVVDPELYRARHDDVVFDLHPTGRTPVVGFEVEFTAGFGTIAGDPEGGADDDVLDVPDFVRRGLLLALADAYTHRESVVVGTVVGKLPETAMDHLAGLITVNL